MPYVVVLTVGVMLILAEVNRIAGQLLSRDGRTFSLSDAVGPLATIKTGQWNGWTDPNALTPGGMIVLHVVIDLVFIVLYTVFLRAAITRMIPRTEPDAAALAAARRRQNLAGVLLVVLIVLDLVEDAFLLLGGGMLAGHQDFPFGLALTTAVFSTLKFASLIVLLVVILWSAGIRQVRAIWWARLRPALYAQRLSAILAFALIVLSLVPWGLILEQVPDLERGWVNGVDGVRHGLVAIGVTVLLSVVFFVIGRKRSELYWDDLVNNRAPDRRWRTYDPDQIADRPRLRPTGWHLAAWIGFPAIVIAGALWVRTIDPALFDPRPFAIFVGVFGALIVGSIIADVVYRWRWIHRQGRAWPPENPHRERDEQHAATVRAYDISHAGDYLAGSFLIIGGLGVARSFAPLALVGVTDDDIGPAASVGYFAIVLAGLAVALLWLRVTRGRLISPFERSPALPADRAAGRPALPEAARTEVVRLRRWLDPRVVKDPYGWRTAVMVGIALAAALTLLFAVLGWPIATGGLLGGVAITVGVLGAWLTLVGLFMLWMRRRRPLALFQGMGLRSDPILTLFVLVPLVIGQLAGSPTLHAIDRKSQSAPQRDTLAVAFQSWLVQNKDCPEVDGGIRPLVLVASEGGGVRAAAWTVDTLSQFSAAGACAASSVFLSSGVSGGSVGLAIAANTPGDPGQAAAERMRQDVLTLSRSSGLPTAISGLVVSDPLASTTGVRLPTFEAPGSWRDRASLIEHSWRLADPDLAKPFDGNASPSTGWIVFNSTDVRSGCRVIVSQLEVGTSSGSTTGNPNELPRCDQGVAEPPLTIDLLDYFDRGCDFNVDWATAALLSARFPVVTPAGGVGDESDAECQRVPRLQLVDGGYAENSGLGLIADISPRIARLVQEYNSHTRERGEPLVVPYLLYIQNSPGGYIAEGPRNDIAELTVPIVGNGTGATQVAPSSWIQRIMTTLEPICEPPRCRLGTPTPPSIALRTVIMAIGTEPSVTVPLGWGLSTATFEQLRRDADAQGSADCHPPDWSSYSCFGRLVHLYD
jgi:hypothetical protein